MTDIHSLKRPYVKRFTKKNSIHPFEDAASLEFFAQKNDTSLLLFGSHSKKRPHCLTWIRCFNGSVLDMMETCINQETARTLQQFKTEKCKVGVKPLLSFSGAQFSSPVPNQYTLAKSLLLDFFRGPDTNSVDVEGLQMLISFAAGENDANDQATQINMRCWRIISKRSGQRIPRVEIEEMGPRIDFRIGRFKQAEDSSWKEAMKKSKGTEVETFTAPNHLEIVLTRTSSHRRNLKRTLRPTLWETRLGGSTWAGKILVSYKPGRRRV